MTDGVSMLMATTYGQFAAGRWSLNRHDNLLDGAAPFYTTYQCSDGKWVAVGAIEPQFYAALLERIGLPLEEFQPQHQRSHWARRKQRIAAVFLEKTQAVWCKIMEGIDACFTPVLDMSQAPSHPHNLARQTFTKVEGVLQPAPAPRFSRTHPEIRPRGWASRDSILTEFGFSASDIAALEE